MSPHDKASAYLARHSVLTLATDGPAGLWAAAVFYVNADWTLYFLSAPGTRHGRNVLESPAVAATVQEDYSEWLEIRGIQLEGEARRIEGRERDTAIELYAKKFPVIRKSGGSESTGDDSEVQNALRRVDWFRLEPRRVYFIDNSLGLGHRDEIPGPFERETSS